MAQGFLPRMFYCNKAGSSSHMVFSLAYLLFTALVLGIIRLFFRHIFHRVFGFYYDGTGQKIS